MGGSKWLNVKIALGLKLNSCLYVPRTTEASPPPPVGRSPPPPPDSDVPVQMPKHSSKSSKNVCAICLSTMKLGQGHAIFTSECSHSFHFHCIASNVKHGKQSCPVCRAKWKETPLQSTDSKKLNGRPTISDPAQLQHDAFMRPPRRISSPWAYPKLSFASKFHVAEPPVFDDDDEVVPNLYDKNTHDGGCDGFSGAIEVEMYPEVSAVPKSKAIDEFSILVHLKAPITVNPRNSCVNIQASRAPVDLITVLDVSGSMAGTKLALLKRAMGFVIQNLSPSDRLSVIAFSSTARRLFRLRRMTDDGRQEALKAVNALTSNGGTNIAEGLRKAAKVLTDCRWKNPIASIILLSDGRDTYTNRTPSGGNSSMHQSVASGFNVPIHVFGFGIDHDPISMHIISENSGGTFSFIEAESEIQDSFALCLGGLLSVVVQDLKVEVECVDPTVHLVLIKSGSYKTVLASDKRKATIEVGDLYAEEERDFLIITNVPIHESGNETSLIKVKCHYKHPVCKNNLVTLGATSEVKIQRPVSTGDISVSMEVDRQRNRLRSAEAMSEASAAAERGDLTFAVSVLENCRKVLSETVSARAEDRLCMALDAELREMGERIASRQAYETSGRAYVLSGLSSHSWQRATARGDSTDGSSLVQAYQTTSMIDMVNLSQTMALGSPTQAVIRPTRLRPR